MDIMSISTGNPKIDHWVGVVGTLVTVASFFAGSLNQKIRLAMDTEGEVPVPFLYAALVLNYLAVNLDKAAQMHKLLKGLPVPKTEKTKQEPKENEAESENAKP